MLVFFILRLMRVSLRYGRRVLDLELPQTAKVYIAEPKEAAGADLDIMLSRALKRNLDDVGFESLTGSGEKVMILVDDYTRETPTKDILPPLLEMFRRNGIRSEDVTVMMALGTHRKPTAAELREKLGPVVDEYRVTFHDAENCEYMKLGSYKGIPILVNREVVEHDLVLGVGMIVPHRVSGFSGGSKIIQPGVSAPETTGYTHWISAGIPGREILGTVDNEVRRVMDVAAERAGLRAVLNVVLDSGKKAAGVFFGGFREVLREGASEARRIFGVKLPWEADIVIAECPPPKDINLWQAAKAIYSATLAVKKGGSIVLAARCPEGAAPEHPEVERYGYMPYPRVKELIEEGEVEDLIAAAHMAHVGEAVERANAVYLVSEMGRRKVEKLGLVYARSLDEAVEDAVKTRGKSCRILVMKDAPDLLPLHS